MRTSAPACIAVISLLAPLLALAHHSTRNFDLNRSTTVTGTVKYFSFTSPHSFIDLDVPEKSGAVHHYKIFSVAKVVMVRTGWTTGDVKPGDTVTVTINPDKKDPNYVYLEKITFANGRIWDRTKIF